MRRRLAAGLCCGALVGLSASSAWAVDRASDILVHGDSVEYHETEHTVLGHGHIIITHQDSRITCDRAVIALATHDAFLSGRVELDQPGGTLTGEEILYNFETQKGTVLKAKATAEPWRATGTRMARAADNGFVTRRGYLTTCDFDPPHTRLQSREIRVIPDDRVIIHGAVMYVGPVPVFYLPSYTHQLNDRRPRVVLTPGYSKEWGPFLLTSWRYYIHENLQGRILLDERERRHIGEGVDTRYRVNEDSRGILRTYYTHERRYEKGHSLIGSVKDQTTGRERYRVQWRHRWIVDPETTATAEFHKSKDDRLIREFFRAEYEQDAHPKTYLEVVHSNPLYGLTFLTRRRVNGFEGETELLPELRYDVRPMELPWQRPWLLVAPWMEHEGAATPREEYRDRLGGDWYYQSNSSYDAFVRKVADSGVDARVKRLDTFHQVSYQTRLLGALNVTPLVNTRQTWYSRGATGDGDLLRGIFSTGVDVNTKFFRIFNVNSDVAGLDIHRLRHVISPSVSYRYQQRPTVVSSRLLQMDSLDGLDIANLLTPSLDQTLQTKRGTGAKAQLVNLVRLGLGTSYQFRTPLNSGGRFNNATESLELRPYSWLLSEQSLEYDTHHQWPKSASVDLVAGPGVGYRGDTATATTQALDLQTTANTQIPWSTGFGWRWLRDQNSQVTFESIFNVGKKWRLAFYERADVRRLNSDGSKFVNRPAESEFRILRDLHEWTVELIVNRRRTEGNLLLLVFRLKAAPEQPFEFQRSYNRPKLGDRRAIFAG